VLNDAVEKPNSEQVVEHQKRLFEKHSSQNIADDFFCVTP
jgi:hypothetical protein